VIVNNRTKFFSTAKDCIIEVGVLDVVSVEEVFIVFVFAPCSSLVGRVVILGCSTAGL